MKNDLQFWLLLSGCLKMNLYIQPFSMARFRIENQLERQYEFFFGLLHSIGKHNLNELFQHVHESRKKLENIHNQELMSLL